MLASDSSEVFGLLPQAVAQVDTLARVVWVEPAFGQKTGLELRPGQPLLEVVEPGPVRNAVERAVSQGVRYQGDLVTCALRQARVRVQPAAEGGSWVLFEPAGLDDDVAFAGALQEIARALGETNDVDEVCAAAVVAMVRCSQVRRAEVYLVEELSQLRRVASVADAAAPKGLDALPEASLKHALATGHTEVGVARSLDQAPGAIFAAVPLSTPRRTLGLLVLYKDCGSSFSVRELDLWSAAAGQISVGVENARLLNEAQAALRIRDEFMSIASHELKTPLTPLKMCLYTMERRISQELPVDLASVVKAQRQVDRLTGLVNDLLDASRIELGKLAMEHQPLELAQLVVEVVDQFRLTFEREFDVRLPADRLWVFGDRDRLEQVLVNLLENAHKYSQKEEPIRVELARLGEEVCLSVVDRGIGIPTLEQARIFQRFYRATNASNRNFGGLGLGLFLSHAIVQLHGGSLCLSSEEGKGSTFAVRLPKLSAKEVQSLPRRVLLVLEEADSLAQVEAALKDAGYEVLSAHDGAEALRKMSHLPVDAALVSSTLPQGALFAETISRLPLVRPLPVVFLGEGAPCWASPVARVCGGPSGKESLLEAVREAIEGEPLLATAV
ncbi:MAG: GAF domain-containing protein [Myxococcales bacterium]|nr:GAF domain-containing protein [Myxococcales bacterium]